MLILYIDYKVNPAQYAMKKWSPIFVIIMVNLIGVCENSTIHRLFQQQYFSGTWNQALVLGPIGPCTPCHFSFSFDSSSATFQIYNSINPSNIHKFELALNTYSDQLVFFDRTLYYFNEQSYTSDRLNPIKASVEILPRDGVIYNMVIEMNNFGLYIEHSQTKNEYSIFITSILYTVCVCFFIPIRQQHIQRSMAQIYKRTCLFSLYFYGQLVTTITVVQASIAILYVYNAESYVVKFISYCIFATCFLMGLVHSTYIYAIIQRQLNHYLPRQTLYKFVLMCITMLIGLMLYPLFLTSFHKGPWFYYYTLTGLIVQLIMSHNSKVLPYKKFMILYVVSVFYLAVQTDQYAIVNFCQLTFAQLFCLAISSILLVIGGVFWLRSTKKAEMIDQMFKNQTRTTQNRSTTDAQSDKSTKNVQLIKSDFQLEPKIQE